MAKNFFLRSIQHILCVRIALLFSYTFFLVHFARFEFKRRSGQLRSEDKSVCQGGECAYLGLRLRFFLLVVTVSIGGLTKGGFGGLGAVSVSEVAKGGFGELRLLLGTESDCIEDEAQVRDSSFVGEVEGFNVDEDTGGVEFVRPSLFVSGCSPGWDARELWESSSEGPEVKQKGADSEAVGKPGKEVGDGKDEKKIGGGGEGSDCGGDINCSGGLGALKVLDEAVGPCKESCGIDSSEHTSSLPAPPIVATSTPTTGKLLEVTSFASSSCLILALVDTFSG